MRALTLLIPLLLAAPAALAQDDGCTETAPCVWAMDVDQDGFVTDGALAEWNGTSGDWFVLDVFNLDASQDHTLSAPGLGIELEVASLSSAESVPFILPLVEGQATYPLTDAPTGAVGTLRVFERDVVEEEAAAGAGAGDGSGDGIPFLTLPFAALGLLAAAAMPRRPS